MSSTVKAIYCEARNIGKHIKATKKKLQWKLELDGRPFCIELYLSRLTNKVKVLVNGDIKLNSKRNSGVAFAYSFKLGKTIFMVMQKENDYDLRIDNIAFSELYVSDVGRLRFDEDFKINDEADNWEPTRKEKTSSWETKRADPFEKEQWSTRKDGACAEWEAESQPYFSAYSQAMNKRMEDARPQPPTKHKPQTISDGTRTQTTESHPIPSAATKRDLQPSEAKQPEQQLTKPKADLVDLMAAPAILTLPQELFSVQPYIYAQTSPAPAYPPYRPVEQPAPSQLYTTLTPQPCQSYNMPSSSQLNHPYTMPAPSQDSPPDSEPHAPQYEQDSLQALATGVVDLDSLHLGDKYSPPIASKLAKRQPTVKSDQPDVPMYKQMPPPAAPQTVGWSPQAMMQYMTGMMMQQMSQRPY